MRKEYLFVREFGRVGRAGSSVVRRARQKRHDHHGIERARNAVFLIVHKEQHEQEQSEDIAVIRHITLICAVLCACECVIMFL